MKVLVVYPPLVFPNNVYAAIPILLGQLINRGIDADALDMNVEFLKDILSIENIKQTKKKIERMYDENPDNKEFREIVEYFLQRNNTIDEVINNNKNIYSDLIDKNISEENEKKLNDVLSFLFLPTYPSGVKLFFSERVKLLIERLSGFKYNYADIMEKCSDDINNIYVEYFKKKIKEINVEQYDLVAITVPFESHLYQALTLAKVIKEETSVKVAIGGVLLNGTIDSYIKHDDMFDVFADVFLLGEGERSLPEYIEYLEGKRPLSKVSGAVYKENGIVKNNGFARIKSIDEIKPPSFKGIYKENYRNFGVSLEFSKGCYWGKCAYCYSNLQKRYHLIDVKKAVDIVENIVNEYGYRNFEILDDSLNPKFAEKFTDEIIKRNLDIEYFAFFRFEKTLNRKFIEKMKKSGLLGAFFGLESASPRILKLMNKGIDLRQVERILKVFHNLGLKAHIGVMFGYPTETEEDVITTLEFLKKNSDYIKILNLFYFTLLKSSGLMKNLGKVGIERTINHEEFSEYLVHVGSCISRKRLNELLKEYGLSALNIYSKW